MPTDDPPSTQRLAALRQLDGELSRAVERRVVPCIVAMAAAGDGSFYEGSFGPVSPGSIFWVQSMVKAITATACMQLVERGTLRLDQHVGDLLPQLRRPRLLEGFGEDGAPVLREARRPITLKHLLTHTSGFTESTWSRTLLRYEGIVGDAFVPGHLGAPTNLVLEFEPGERWQYGTSMAWAGKVLEAVTGQTLFDYFERNIFGPLGMRDTGYDITPEQTARLAPAARRLADGSAVPIVIGPSDRPDFHRGSGSLFTTPRDYMVFLRMLLNDGVLPGVRILQADTVQFMRSNQIGELDVQTLQAGDPAVFNDVNLFPGMRHKWGISFDINPEPGPDGRSAASFAWGGGPNTYYWVDPVRGVIGLFMTQLRPFADAQALALLSFFERHIYFALDDALDDGGR